MWDNNLNAQIAELFEGLRRDADKISASTPDQQAAVKQIMETVSSRVTAAVSGYLFDLYFALSEKTLEEPIFQEAGNANRFYALNLRQQIADRYQFNIQSLPAYGAGLDIHAISQAYAAAAAAAGSAAAGGILLGILHEVISLPFVVVIAGAALAGMGGGVTVYTKVVPARNQASLQDSAALFLTQLEGELRGWVGQVISFYNQKVDELKQTL